MTATEARAVMRVVGGLVRACEALERLADMAEGLPKGLCPPLAVTHVDWAAANVGHALRMFERARCEAEARLL